MLAEPVHSFCVPLGRNLSIRCVRALLAILTAVGAVFISSSPSQAATGDRVEGDGTGFNMILSTNKCQGALATWNGQLRPYVKIEKGTGATGSCNLRTYISWYSRSSTVLNVSPRFTRYNFAESAGPAERNGSQTLTCRAVVGVQRYDGSWLMATFYRGTIAGCQR